MPGAQGMLAQAVLRPPLPPLPAARRQLAVLAARSPSADSEVRPASAAWRRLSPFFLCISARVFGGRASGRAGARLLARRRAGGRSGGRSSRAGKTKYPRADLAKSRKQSPPSDSRKDASRSSAAIHRVNFWDRHTVVRLQQRVARRTTLAVDAALVETYNLNADAQAILSSLQVSKRDVERLRRVPQTLADGTYNPAWMAGRRWRITASRFHAVLHTASSTVRGRVAELLLEQGAWWFRGLGHEVINSAYEEEALQDYNKGVCKEGIRPRPVVATLGPAPASTAVASLDVAGAQTREEKVQSKIGPARTAVVYETVCCGNHGMIRPIRSRSSSGQQAISSEKLSAAPSEDLSTKLRAETLGTLVAPELPWLAASPDGVVVSRGSGLPIGLLEVKSFPVHLERGSPAWTQVQGSMAIASRSFGRPVHWCDVIMPDRTSRVKFDAASWAANEAVLRRFYFEELLPRASVQLNQLVQRN